MKINIELDTEQDVDARALAALVGSLGVNPVPSGNPAEVLRGQMEKMVEGTSLEVDHAALDEASALCDAPTEPEAESVVSARIAENPEGAPDVDIRGLPWDERIHAGTKATNVDGSWRNKRGVDKELLEQVEAELRGESGAQEASTPDAGTPNPTTSGTTTESADAENDAPEPPAPEADAPPPPAPIPPAEKTDTGEIHPSFKDAMAVVTAGQRDGFIDQTAVTEAAKALGLTSVVDLAKPDNAHLRAGFIATLG